MTHDAARLRRRYVSAMRGFLADGDEGALREAYEIGREALARGEGVPEFAILQMEALAEVLATHHATGGCDAAARRLGVFVAEGLASFEMTHRVFREANRELRRLNDRLDQRLEDETKRIAHLLHDEVGQDLVTILLALDETVRRSPQDAHAPLKRIRELLDQVEHRLRDLSHELRPAVLDDLGLYPAVEQLARGISQRDGLNVELESGPLGRLPIAVETALYRIVQEALNNVVRHAGARRATVRITCEETTARCSVRDDGVGFEKDAAVGGGGLGLIGLRERIETFGGTLEVRSQIGNGTEVIATIPTEGARVDPGAAR